MDAIATTATPAIKAKRQMTKNRIKNSDLKSGAGKLGPKTIAYIPDDIEVMYAGKNYLDLVEQSTRTTNSYQAFMREYPEISPELKARLDEQYEMFEINFNLAKKKATKLAEMHPLWQRFKDIKGFSATQLGLVMALIKNPAKFHSPSALMVYSGVGVRYGMNVNKLNLNKIKDAAALEGKVFEGFSTIFSGRMEVIIDCLMRSGGWFYDFYNRKKTFKLEKARNDGSVFVLTEDMLKESGLKKDCVGKEYMVGKKNQSLISYADRAAKNAMKRVLLHLIYTEWMLYKGLECRIPYPIEYMGHKHLITVDEIMNYDIAHKAALKAEKE